MRGVPGPSETAASGSDTVPCASTARLVLSSRICSDRSSCWLDMEFPHKPRPLFPAACGLASAAKPQAAGWSLRQGPLHLRRTPAALRNLVAGEGLQQGAVLVH